jgi:hypothetical protein
MSYIRPTINRLNNYDYDSGTISPKRETDLNLIVNNLINLAALPDGIRLARYMSLISATAPKHELSYIQNGLVEHHSDLNLNC